MLVQTTLGVRRLWSTPERNSAPCIESSTKKKVTRDGEELITELEESLGVEAIRNYIGRQLGDVDHTLSDVLATTAWRVASADHSLEVGILLFVDWYRDYYKIKTVGSV